MVTRNPDSFDEQFARAELLEDQGRHAEALERWRELSSERDAVVFCRLGSLAQQLGFLEEAESAFREAIHIDNSFSNAHFGLGSVLMEKGDNEGASQCFKKALSLEKSEYACMMLGVALNRMGRTQEAVDNLEAALQLDPSYDEAYFNLGMIRQETDRVEGKRLLLRAIEIDPEYQIAHRELGWLLSKMDDYPHAEYHLRRALELKPDDGWARIYLGNLLWRRNDVTAAVPEFERAIAVMPENAMSFCSLANVYEAEQRWEEAEDLYEKAIKAEPNSAPAHMNFGRMLAKREDLARAAAHLQLALSLDSDYSEARDLLTRVQSSGTAAP